MRLKIRTLIALILICVGANSAWAGFVNNAGGTATAEDSLAAQFVNLDSLGSAVAMASGDSVYFVCFYPSGSVAFRDSMAYNDSKITLSDWEDFAQGEQYTLRYPIASIDGAGINGNYTWAVIVDDNTGMAWNVNTTTRGTFQLIGTGADLSPSVALTRVDSLRIAATFVLSDIRAVGADAITDNGDGRLEVNVEEWHDGQIPGQEIIGVPDINVSDWGGSGTQITATGSGPYPEVVIRPFGMGWIADSVWRKGGAQVRLSDGDTTAIAMLYHIRDSMDEASGVGPWNATTMDSVLQALDYTNNTHEVARQVASTMTIASPFADTLKDIRQKVYRIGDSLVVYAYGDVVDLGNNTTLVIEADGGNLSTQDNIYDGMTLLFLTGNLKGGARRISSATESAGIVQFNFSSSLPNTSWPQAPADNDRFVILSSYTPVGFTVNVGSITSGAIDSADIDLEAYRHIARGASDSTWAKDTSNTLWNGLSRFGEYNALAQAVIGGAIDLDAATGTLSDAQIDLITTTFLSDSLLGLFTRLNAIRDSMEEASQTGSACGSGSQAVTIVVLDTSGVDAVVPNSYVTILNSGQTAIMAHGPATSGTTGTFGLTASTAYNGLAVANGFYFSLYSFTTGSGASHTDTIRGYDIPTSAGSSVPSSQQVQLFDWVISPSADTLYGAEVTITLSGSSEFYTSTNLVPPATVVVRAGQNDGSANGGKWQETIFGTDSLFSSGVDNATYTITIEHTSLPTPVVYEGLSIPASATPTRLRQILEDQE